MLGQDHHELVAGQARDGVGIAQARAQARRHRHQEHVASLVAHAVVDELEAVQVDQHHPHRMAAAVGPGHCLAETVLQQRAVGQAGQHVVLGHVVHALLGHLARGDVAAGAAVAGKHAILVEDRLAVDAEPALVAVVVEDAVFEILEGLVRRQRRPVRAPGFAVEQVRHHLPACLADDAGQAHAGLFREVAGHGGEAVAGVLFPVPVRGHRHQLAEALLAGLQRLFGALPGDHVVDQLPVAVLEVGSALAHQFVHLARARASRLHEGRQQQGRQRAAGQ
jgi:hypothetical protein